MNEQVLNSNSKKSKKLYFEVMRIAAILLVIFNHTGSSGYVLYENYPIFSLQYWIYILPSVFCRAAVPLFFAISGALLLNKQDEPFSRLWLKRILKFGIILLVFSAVYAAEDHFSNGHNYPIIYFLQLTWSSYSFSVHLWYLYSYIAFLIGIPLLRVLAKNMEERHFRYWAFILVLFNTIPLIEYIMWQDSYTLNAAFKPSWMLGTIVTCPLIGYYLEHRMPHKLGRNELAALWCINIFTILICAAMTALRIKNVGSSGDVFLDNFAFINTIAIYLTIKKALYGKSIPKAVQKIILSLGQCSFGIYLIHILVMHFPFSEKVIPTLTGTGIDPMLAVWIYVIYIFSVSYVITAVLIKIPLIKKLVGG